MMVVLLAACSSAPRFLEPPEGGHNPFLSPSLAGCTYTQDATDIAITWQFDDQGRLRRDEVEAGDTVWEATYEWDGLCLQRLERTVEVPTLYRRAPGSGWTQTEIDLFVCDEHGRWTQWTRQGQSLDGFPITTEVYRFDNRYDNSGQLVEVQVWAEGVGEGQGSTQLGLATFLWYDEHRPLEMKYLTPGDGGANTQTWLWDHDRLIGWDLRGSGAERAMTRTWEGNQLIEEVQTEEELETLTFEYTYADRSARFPRDVYIDAASGAWPRPFGPPRPPTALELTNGLLRLSTIEVTCEGKP